MIHVEFPTAAAQLPEYGHIFFDHVAWMVEDMDAASRTFERLGFILTPYSVHGNRDPETGALVPQGTANRLAMLRVGYIELLCEAGDIEAPVVVDLRQRIDRYEGVHLMAFSTADAVAAHQRIEKDDIAVQPMVHLRRDVEAADGSDTEVQFSVVRAAFDAIPEGRIQVLTHHTPEHMWQSRYISYANGITSLDHAVICVSDPVEGARGLETVVNRQAEMVDEDEMRLECDRGGIRIVTPERLDEIIPGNVDIPFLPYTAFIGFRADDLDVTRRYFDTADILYKDTGTAVIVSPDDALGTGLIIRSAR